MPNFDKTGPEGKGSLTGRGLGDCDAKNTDKKVSSDDKQNTGLGRGLGRGSGKGSGRGLGRRTNRK
jgi:hypothetical protein